MGNIYIITGLSGSGKSSYLDNYRIAYSYRYGYDQFINFDELTAYYNKHKYPYNKYILEFIKRHPCPELSEKEISWERDTFSIHSQFLSFLYNYNCEQPFIIEGIQFIKPYIDRKYIVNATKCESLKVSEFKCLIRRIKRCFDSNKPLRIKIKNLFKYDLNPIHVIEPFQLRKFNKLIKNKNNTREL